MTLDRTILGTRLVRVARCLVSTILIYRTFDRSIFHASLSNITRCFVFAFLVIVTLDRTILGTRLVRVARCLVSTVLICGAFDGSILHTRLVFQGQATTCLGNENIDCGHRKDGEKHIFQNILDKYDYELPHDKINNFRHHCRQHVDYWIDNNFEYRTFTYLFSSTCDCFQSIGNLDKRCNRTFYFSFYFAVIIVKLEKVSARCCGSSSATANAGMISNQPYRSVHRDVSNQKKILELSLCQCMIF